jgi:ABC-2 type transport system permease protein
MSKTLIVAQAEFGTLVRSKALIISIVLMPIIMVISIVMTRAAKDVTDNKDRTFAFVDYTGVLGEPLKAVAKVLSPSLTPLSDRGAPAGARFIPIEVNAAGRQPDAMRVELSDRVRHGELFAFVEIPADVLDPAASTDIRYYSDHPSYTALPDWIRAAVNGSVLNERFRRASIDRLLVARLTHQAPMTKLGLVTRDAAGRVKSAEAVDAARAFGVPFAVIFLMYITVMSSAPQLLNSVIEEKMSRISEVLMGSVTPFQLMMGKLIGSVGVSMLLAGIYIAGALAAGQYWGSCRCSPGSRCSW